MDVSSYILLSHEQALRRRLDVAANNMANSNTVGFKREQPLFHEFVEQTADAPVEDARKTSYVLDHGAVHDTSQGAFQATGNPLDVMIDGPGYLTVTLPDGGTAYTRAGFIKVLEGGELATASGHIIQGENGRPIIVPPEQRAGITIAQNGSVLSVEGALGRLAITSFADENAVSPRGDGLMSGQNGRVLAVGEIKIKTGGVEGSNVQPLVETTAMIEVLRSYQSSQRMLDSINDMRNRAIERLGNIN